MQKEKITKDKITRKVSKALYLKQVLIRLETEYIEILNMVIEYNFTHERGIGFWSLTRIIFPVIETVAGIIGKKKESFLEEDLQVPFGHLVWNIYRHALMHTDELQYAVYRDKTILWAIDLSTEGGGHLVVKQTDSNPTTIHISIPKLYSTLQDFLTKEIAKNDTTQISVQIGVHFYNNTGKLLKELDELTTTS